MSEYDDDNYEDTYIIYNRPTKIDILHITTVTSIQESKSKKYITSPWQKTISKRVYYNKYNSSPA